MILNIFHKKCVFVHWPLLLLLLIGTVQAQDKTPKSKVSNITLKVTDEAGNPIPKASIIVGEGLIHAETDQNGSFSFKAMPEDFISVSSYGYSKKTSLISELTEDNIVLKKAKLYTSNEDLVPMPFIDIKRRNVTGNYYQLKTSDLERYPTNDLRNTFAGLVPGLEVVERDGSVGLNAEEELGFFRVTDKISLYSRGNSPIFIIDDIPVDVTEMPIDPQEIESVTVIKDIVGKAMLGPKGVNGIIYIKTKRGRVNERVMTVNAEKGVSRIDRFPGWASGADYAQLNNTARANSGLTPLYSETAIGEYAKNDPYSFKYPSVDFRQLMLKNTKAFSRVNLSSMGGNETVQYSAYLGYNGEGDIYKIGKVSDYHRINVRSNLDIKVNHLIKVKFDFFGGMTIRRSPNYGYNSNFTSDDGNSNTALDLVEFNTVLNDITNTPPNAYPIFAAFGDTQAPWYAVSSNTSYRQNPIGNIMHNGYYTETGRTGASNLTFEYDMKELVPGLKSKTFVGFNVYNSLRIGKAEDYIAYIATPGTTASGADTVRLTKVHDGTDMSGLAKLHDYYSQRFVIYQNLNYQKAWDAHEVQVGATYYLGKNSRNGIEEPQRLQNAIFTGMYSFKDKYIFQGVVNYAGTYGFAKGERYGTFPSAGIGWVISEEGFMRHIKKINYLKFRAEAGILGFEGNPPAFSYLDRWGVNTSGSAFGPYSTNQWFGSNTDNQVYRTSPSRIGNPNLTWEKRKEFSIGLDALLFNNKIFAEISYYNNLRDGIIVQQAANTIPYTAGVSNARPYINANTLQFKGVELGIQYSDKLGILKYSLGGNASVQNSKVVRWNEPDYRFEYQGRTGKAADSYFGQTYLGKFANDAETEIIPQIYDETLKAGDLKYQDLNNDGVIDDNDQSQIGHTSPRLIYSANIRLSLKNFEFTAIGAGRAFYSIPMTNKYFQNGWDNNNYSNFVKENMDGAYPRLTYQKVNNNFVASNYWLRDGGFFKIQNAELAYNVPIINGKVIGARHIRLYVRGANLLTFSKIKDVDPESINSGVTVYPLFKTFTAGIKLTF